MMEMLQKCIPSKPIKNLTEWFDELQLEDKLKIYKYITKITNRKIRKMEHEMNESMKRLHIVNKELEKKK